jgi:glycosyltransferase involved in cell wall biosynthesis
MSSNDPLVSVVMTVYNVDEYLAESIESILNQTFRNFEFIIICDEPSDKAREIINNYQKNDNRINVIYQKKVGLVASAKIGCSIAKGKYIARMDADDISLPNRFEREVAFMDANPRIGVCGTWLKTFGSDKKDIWAPPTEHDDIFAEMLFECMIYQPTVIIRKDVIFSLREFYDETFKFAEDMEYWSRLVNLGVKIANIGEVFLLYRIHEKQVHNIYNEKLKKNADRIRYRQLKHLGIEPTEEEFIIYNRLKNGNSSKLEHLDEVSKYIDKILEANKITGIYSEPALCRVLARKWFQLCSNSTRNGFLMWHKYNEKFGSKYITLTYKQKVLFLLKCFMHINRMNDIFDLTRRDKI